MTVTVTLPDGKALELQDGATGADAAAAIGAGLARAALAVEVGLPGGGEDPELHDLGRPLPDGARIAILTEKSGEQALQLIRHDAAHVLAEAVLELYPGVKISIGPATARTPSSGIWGPRSRMGRASPSSPRRAESRRCS